MISVTFGFHLLWIIFKKYKEENDQPYKKNFDSDPINQHAMEQTIPDEIRKKEDIYDGIFETMVIIHKKIQLNEIIRKLLKKYEYM